MSEEIVCPPRREFCTSHCENHKKCEALRKKMDQELFNEIMDEAERLNPKPKLTKCLCDTCNYDGEVCELENVEPHTSRLVQECYDYETGEEEERDY